MWPCPSMDLEARRGDGRPAVQSVMDHESGNIKPPLLSLRIWRHPEVMGFPRYDLLWTQRSAWYSASGTVDMALEEGTAVPMALLPPRP